MPKYAGLPCQHTLPLPPSFQNSVHAVVMPLYNLFFSIDLEGKKRQDDITAAHANWLEQIWKTGNIPIHLPITSPTGLLQINAMLRAELQVRILGGKLKTTALDNTECTIIIRYKCTIVDPIMGTTAVNLAPIAH